MTANAALRKALAAKKTPGRPDGVFTLTELCEEEGCGTDRARRILHEWARSPGITPVNYTHTSINGRSTTSVGYRLKGGRT